jgi:quercetin dioxygenase-like cupin family protein
MAQARPQPVSGRDPVSVDPAHYKVESENQQVRVLRARYGPKAKSVMHSHPATVAIFLTDARCRFTFPNGKTEDHDMKAGTTMAMEATEHLPENIGDTPFEVILVELKR